MTDPVVLVPLDGSKNAPRTHAIATRLAELQKGSVRVLPLTEGAGLQPGDLRGAGLIVICSQSDAAPSEDLSAAALTALRGGHCPVVLVNPAEAPARWDLHRVVAPHDGSPAVSRALGPAIELVRAAGAELIVLQVAGGDHAQETGSIASPAYLDQVQHSWPVWSGEFLQRLASLTPMEDIQVRLLVAHGLPSAETIRVVGEVSADLIVLAWKGHWEPQRASILKALLPNAPCPIMVLRTSAA